MWLPFGVVAKVVSALTAILLAYSVLKSDIAVLQTEIDHLNKRMERIELKLDQFMGYGHPQK